MVTSRYIKVKEKTENKWLIPSFVGLFAILGVTFAAGGFTYARYITAVILGLGVLLDIDDLFCLICFSLPFASMLKFSLGSTTIIAVLYIVILFKLMSKERMNLPPISFFAFLLFASMQTLTIFFYDSIITNVFSTLLNVAFVLFISAYFTSGEFKNPKLLTSASFCLSLSCTLMLLLNDIFPQLPSLAHPQRAAELVEANRYGATVLDPNELSQLILISICLLVAILPSFKHFTGKLLIFSMITYISITGTRTNSKSYVISIFLLFVYLMFVYLRNMYQNERFNSALVKTVLLVFLALVVCILLIIYVVIPVFESRGSEQTDILTNRSNIWTNYLSALFQSPDVLLIGCGSSNVTAVLRLLGRETNVVPHNTYIEFVIQYGFGGLALLFAIWKKAFGEMKNKLNSFYSLAVAAFLITSFGISVDANDCLYILFALLSIPLSQSANETITKSHKQR